MALPTSPTNLRASSPNSGGNDSPVYLIWNDNSNNETHFKVMRSASASGPFYPDNRPDLAPGTTTFTESPFTGARQWYYVAAVNAEGQTQTNTVEIVVGGGTPVTPNSTYGTVGQTTVDLSWSSVPNNTGYRILLSTTSASAGFAQVGAQQYGTSITLTGLNSATQYWIKIVAMNGTDQSADSNILNFFTAASGGGTTQTQIPIIDLESHGKIWTRAIELKGTAEAGAVITFYDNNTLLSIGNITADSTGIWAFVPVSALPATSNLRLKAQAQGKLISEFTPFIVCEPAPVSTNHYVVTQLGTQNQFRGELAAVGGTSGNPTFARRNPPVIISSAVRTTIAEARQDCIVHARNN